MFGGYAWKDTQVSVLSSFGLGSIPTPCFVCLVEGDFATLSRDRSQVIRPGSEIRAEMNYPEGLAFGHVLRILSIIHEVSPNYFLIGVSTMTHALKSMILKSRLTFQANCWF